MTTSRLHYLELLEVGRQIRSRELSSVEVTRAQLERIRELDGQLRSYTIVLAGQALQQAAQADAEIAAGNFRGPLHGVPIGIKDLCWTKGVKTAAGMKLYENFIPVEDGTVVHKLREAGAVTLGKLKLTESAYAEHHPSVAPPVNPWNRAYWVGVSSSGSGVATAAGMCYGSIGTDTGGSIRFPCGANGLTGIKPTWGRVSRFGAFELAATLDHIGPMARSAADAGALLQVIAGADPRDPTASLKPVPGYLEHAEDGVRGVRIGIDSSWNTNGVDEPTQRTMAEALKTMETLGAEIIDIAFPDPSRIIEDWTPFCAIEAAVAHEGTHPSRKGEYGSVLSALIELGRSQSAIEYQKMILRRLDFAGRVRILFEDIDLLLIPCTPFKSPKIEEVIRIGDDPDLRAALLRYSAPFDMTGSPTITLPGGFTDAGMPIGFQLVARQFDEVLLVRAGAAFQRATEWHAKHPDI